MNYSSILLSGPPASGKSTLATRLSPLLGWPVYSVGQYWRNQFNALQEDEKRKNIHNSISFENWWRNTNTEDNLKADQAAKSAFQKGNVIGETRYAIHCKDMNSLLVFVTASIDTRAKRALNTDKYRGKSLAEITHILRERQADELRTGKDMYGGAYDYLDIKPFHVLLNSEMMTPEQEVRSILDYFQ